jgi:hypothetical protein
LNPWLRESYLTNPGQNKYEIKLPASNESGLIPFELYPEQKQVPDTLIGDTTIAK